nr:MAG TPA_asm: hypothetical protein [Caudoviricetes sp.]DAL61649.1 MAG TPA_asm: hypothetical protein [Caudoviricetes sp.]
MRQSAMGFYFDIFYFLLYVEKKHYFKNNTFIKLCY